MTPVRRDLPAGTVTFLFTDVEASTQLLHELGAERYANALAEHRRILREAFRAHSGVEVDTQGDAFFYAFPTAIGALDAARAGLDGLRSGGPRCPSTRWSSMPSSRSTPELAPGADGAKPARSLSTP